MKYNRQCACDRSVDRGTTRSQQQEVTEIYLFVFLLITTQKVDDVIIMLSFLLRLPTSLQQQCSAFPHLMAELTPKLNSIHRRLELITDRRSWLSTRPNPSFSFLPSSAELQS